MQRRTFLTAGAGLTVTFLAGCALPVIPKRPAPTASDGLSWIRFSGGRYALFVPRTEMGQNIATALKQIACDELGISLAQLQVNIPSTADIARVKATVGSDSIKDFALPLAQACATLRDAISAGMKAGSLTMVERDPGTLRAFANSARYVGKAALVEQSLAIVTGLPLYAADVRRPGMMFGRVLRAPASTELPSRPASMNQAAARAVPGFVALIKDERLIQGASLGVGIVGRTPGALERIAGALNVQWKIEGAVDPGAMEAGLDVGRLQQAGKLRHQLKYPAASSGDAGEKPWDIDLSIQIPLAAHGSIEPRAAVAEFDSSGRLELWAGSQDLFYLRDVAASRLGLPLEQIVVHGHRVGGAFGGKTICTVELEAAILAQACGAPVKVQWSREQELQLGFHRPPSNHRIRARVSEGRLTHWWHGFASSHILFTNAVVPAWLQRFTDFIGDDGVARGAMLPYRAHFRRSEFEVVRLPVLTGPWRGLGAGPNCLAIESAMDECARRAAMDPVRFRIVHAEHPRLKRVLERAAGAAAWQAPRATARAGVQTGRGVACGVYKAMSFAAVIADVEIDIASGQIRVTRMVCAHDCGRVINPDQVRAQCEGNLVWGIGMIRNDHLPVGQSGVTASTFADAPIPRISDVPPIDVVLVDEGDAPTGAGETAIVAAAGAVANAIRDASGIRLTRLPVAALKGGKLPA